MRTASLHNGPSLILDEEQTCAYYGDRTAQMGFTLYRDISEQTLQTAENYRRYKFERLREGFLSETFAAAATLCSTCRACVPLRINVGLFEQTKSQQTMVRQADRVLDTFFIKAGPYPNLHRLYRYYMQDRHPESRMAEFPRDTVMNMFAAGTDMVLINSRYDSTLRAVAVIDRVGSEASLDHVVYDPYYVFKNVSLGRLAWIKAQEWAKHQGIKSLYIGAVNDSAKMRYKADRNPDSLEAFDNGSWKRFDPAVHKIGPDYMDSLIKLGVLTPE